MEMNPFRRREAQAVRPLAINPGGLQIQIPPVAARPPREIEIQVDFQGELLPGLVLYAVNNQLTGDYKLNGVRGRGFRIDDLVRAEIEKEYVVPPGTLILLNNVDVNRAVYDAPQPLKKKDAMDVDGGRKRRRRKTRKTRRTRSYRYLKG